MAPTCDRGNASLKLLNEALALATIGGDSRILRRAFIHLLLNQTAGQRPKDYESFFRFGGDASRPAGRYPVFGRERIEAPATRGSGSSITLRARDSKDSQEARWKESQERESLGRLPGRFGVSGHN